MTPQEARRILAAAGVPDPATDARRLFDFACRRGRKAGSQERDKPNRATLDVYRAAIEKRAARVPDSRIVGGREFWESWFNITPDVLDPRPETETLIEAALRAPFSRVLDLGTGSGCIVISLLLARPEARGVGTDLSERALHVAADNAERLGVSDRLDLVQSDWFDDVGARFDLIVSNPPYIAAGDMAELQPEVRDHEPRIALCDEVDGLSGYRRIADGAPVHLTPGGRVLVEIGADQASAVTALFQATGLEDLVVLPDLDGRDRVVSARRADYPGGRQFCVFPPNWQAYYAEIACSGATHWLDTLPAGGGATV